VDLVIDSSFQNMSTASVSLASVFAVDTQYNRQNQKPSFYRSASVSPTRTKPRFPRAGRSKTLNLSVEANAITASATTRFSNSSHRSYWR